MEQVLNYALLAVLTALCGAAILRLTEFRQENRLIKIAKDLAKAEGFKPKSDGQLPRIYRPQLRILEQGDWRGAIDRYVEKLRTRQNLIQAANKRFGEYILWAFIGFVVALLLASAALLGFSELVFADAGASHAFDIVKSNFEDVISYYTNACPEPVMILGGYLVSSLSMFHKYAITTIVSGLFPFLLVFIRRPSIFAESLREAQAHLRVFGSGNEAGYTALRALLKEELQGEEVQQQQEFRLSYPEGTYDADIFGRETR